MKKRFSVLVTRRLHRSALEELEKKCNVHLHSGEIPITKKNLINKIKDMDGLICHPYDIAVSYTHLTLPTTPYE